MDPIVHQVAQCGIDSALPLDAVLAGDGFNVRNEKRSDCKNWPARYAIKVNRALADRLVALAAHDLATRARLAEDGSLFGGYNPKMRAVHESNARQLDTIIGASGWPTAQEVGDDGAEAAWLIAQHAIGLPDFQRKCFALLQAEVAAGQAPSWQMAMMCDRIRIYEGRLQLYGTQFDWDDEGQMSPRPSEDPDGVDRRRGEVGLEPLADAIVRHKAQSASQPKPTDLAERRKQMDDWAKSVGWR